MIKDNKQKIRIGFDARFYGPLGKGLGRYTKEVVDRVTAMGENFEYVVFLSADNYDEFIPSSSQVKKVLADVPWYGLSEQFLMPKYIAKEKLDLMHFPHFNVPLFCPCPFVVTVHDLILTKFPTMRATTLGPFKYFLKNLAYRLVINRAVRSSKRIIAVSDFTKRDIVSQFKVKPSKVEVIYEGVADLEKAKDDYYASKLKEEDVLSDYCILEPYLLYVGNAYPHKNLEFLLGVFKDLKHEYGNLKLVLVGKEDYFYARLKERAQELGLWSSLPNREADWPVIFPGYVPDEQLRVLFLRALAYVFPSRYEGFGLPPLEAMAHNCPVISSNTTCLPEILGEAAEYFDPTKEESLRKAIERIITDQKRREELVALGQERRLLYNWHTCAEKTFKLYLEVLK